MLKMFKKNCCDGIYNSYDIHFTNFCDNKCSFCVDKNAIVKNSGVPDWRKMADAVINNQDGFDDVLVLGGEPCLFLEELNLFVDAIKAETKLKVFVTTAVPKTCFDKKDLFYTILEKLDGINLSVQHHDEKVADKIRGTVSEYDRQSFYAGLPYKHKIRININIVSGALGTRMKLIRCLRHYGEMGFREIKLSEIQHDTNSFISFEDMFNVKLPSPYSGGCQSYLNTKDIMGIYLSTPVLLKRSCFICESTLTASLLDGVKLLSRVATKRPIIDNTNFGVVYEDGTIASGWLKQK